ncbi:sigma-54-dependent transcriptional regulator [Marinobacter xestospongiae]|uniref:Sigma-54 dependent transcriptional regulator n=1 Tax=Marinobacter xestospongiae TaxID=994319 RepID=A0ABU3VWJ1_9GAMM|nr:sigma-54 dependent transcriptional regulator [Marinobacter xestospongiae]MDV2078626.1 sigma-54 dependent transcriptional regulator [Marinobacter xestospongiae]
MKTPLLMIQASPLATSLHQQLIAADYDVRLVNGTAPELDPGTPPPSLILLDAAVSPDIVPVLRDLSLRYPGCPVITLVDAGQSALAGEAMHHGAMDYLLKPFTGEQLVATVNHALSLNQPIPDMVVASPASQQVLLLAKKAAQTNASILIGGESGTGKECLARYIHDQSPRAKGPYVAVNCAAIPETMLESTLFGHARGAFTGAQQSQTGKFELANGGTLVLDEISEMPLALQAKLLRVLQERELEKLGSNQKVKLDVRVIAASNRDLRAEAAAGRFREDLFYRLDVLPLSWPALRQRQEDILPLARHFLAKHAPESGFELHPDAARALLAHDWPGNVRELENTIQRALILARGLVLQTIDLMLPDTVTAPTPAQMPAASSLQHSRRSAEFQHVLDTLRRFNGHRKDTAEALGVTTRALRYKLAAMREQGIDINQAAVTG